MKQLIPIALASVLAIACSDDGNLSSANDVERVYHVHDTTYIDTFTITDTLVLTSVDTLVINNTDTSIITHTDTNYITKVDTQYITQHDTIYVEDDEDEVVVVHDTIVKTEYETKYDTVTIYETVEGNNFNINNLSYKFEFYKECSSARDGYSVTGICSTPTYTTQCLTYGDSITWTTSSGSYVKSIRGFSWVNEGNGYKRQATNDEQKLLGTLIQNGVADFDGDGYYYDASGFNPCQGLWRNTCPYVKVRLCD